MTTMVATREHPILMHARSVRGIIEGRKTQTRRVVKLTAAGHVKEPGGHRRWHPGDPDAVLACPYGQPGDRLWVRETFMVETNRGIGVAYPPPFTDGRPVMWCEDVEYGRFWKQAYYKASDPMPDLVGVDDQRCSWRPSIHMPRWASRLMLAVTAVWFGVTLWRTWREKQG
jgi:hypothetical protein